MSNRETNAMPPKRPRRRSSINGPRNVLRVEGGDPNYVYRVVNNVGDRVAAMEDLGYEVSTENLRVGDRRAGKPGQTGSAVEVSVGQGTKAVVMRIHKDYYNEDQKAKQAEVKESEDAMHRQSRRESSDYGTIKVSDKE